MTMLARTSVTIQLLRVATRRVEALKTRDTMLLVKMPKPNRYLIRKTIRTEKKISSGSRVKKVFGSERRENKLFGST